MSKVKLDLRSKDFVQLAAFATNHRNAMVGNAFFVAPIPKPAVYDAALLAYQTKLNEITAAEVDLQTLRAERDALRIPLELNLTGRGSYVESQSGGDTAQILSAAFELQAIPSATTSIDKPYNMVATMGDSEGEIDLSCHAVPKAGGYVSERREHSDIAAPGPWGNDKFSTRSSVSYTGLVSGQKYAFRTKAMGPNNLEGPWSDEVICMAP
jgi:hypothetical protein